jgi:hypothetical protein
MMSCLLIKNGCGIILMAAGESKKYGKADKKG